MCEPNQGVDPGGWRVFIRASTGGGGVDATCVQIGLSGEENYTLKGEEFIQFLFTKSETLQLPF